MILANLLVGFATMLACLIVQAAVAVWSVRYYARQSSDTAVPRRFVVNIRPLLIAMLAMTAGNFIQITVWAILFLLYPDSSGIRRNLLPTSSGATLVSA